MNYIHDAQYGRRLKKKLELGNTNLVKIESWNTNYLFQVPDGDNIIDNVIENKSKSNLISIEIDSMKSSTINDILSSGSLSSQDILNKLLDSGVSDLQKAIRNNLHKYYSLHPNSQKFAIYLRENGELEKIHCGKCDKFVSVYISYEYTNKEMCNHVDYLLIRCLLWHEFYCGCYAHISYYSTGNLDSWTKLQTKFPEESKKYGGILFKP